MALDNQGILEALLYTAGDEGLEEKQLLEILDISLSELQTLINNYHSEGLVIQHFGQTYVLTTKKKQLNILKHL